MAPLLFGWLGIFLLVLAGAFAVPAWRASDALRQAKRAPLVRAVEARAGLVRVEGVAEALDGRTVEAPLSGAQALVVMTRLDAVLAPLVAQAWQTLHHGTEGVRFAVRDESGVVAVDPREAELEGEPSHASFSGLDLEPSTRVRAFMARHGVKPEMALRVQRRARAREWALRPGERVRVQGVARVEADRVVLGAGGLFEPLIIGQGAWDAATAEARRRRRTWMTWATVLALAGVSCLAWGAWPA